uniref:Uncharacterized protein n=1 Tax=Amphimedon queenslandica TaxID=400682 RepID=A0A1X7UKW6_AMPQE
MIAPQLKEETKLVFESNTNKPMQYLLNIQSILSEDVLALFYDFVENQASLDDTYKILYISIRTSNWKLRMSSLKNIAPLFAAYDRLHYQRLSPDHIADIQSYPEAILLALEEGSFTVKLSPGVGHATALDESHPTALVDNSTVNKKVEENIMNMRSLIKASNFISTTTTCNRGLVNTFNGTVASNEQNHDLINA